MDLVNLEFAASHLPEPDASEFVLAVPGADFSGGHGEEHSAHQESITVAMLDGVTSGLAAPASFPRAPT